MSTEPSVTASAPPSQVQPLPEFLAEAHGPVPVRPVWIPWPVAIFLAPLFWLMPKRFGPHVAAAGWRAAIAVYLTWTVYAMACLILAQLWSRVAGYRTYDYGLFSYLAGLTPSQSGTIVWPAATFWEIVRTPLVFAAQMAEGPGYEVERMYGLFALGHVGGLLLAAALMPYATIGERGKLLLGRLIRLVLWSSTSLMVAAVVIQGLETLDAVARGKSRYAYSYYVSYESLVIAIWAAWAVWLVWRGSQRYVGPAEGPAWEPRPPRCEQCGYIITGLYETGTCPECNFPVAQSMPHLRQRTAFSLAASRRARFTGFWRTLVEALVRRDFFRRTALQAEHAVARRYAMWMAILTGAILAGGIAVTDMNRMRGLSTPDWISRYFGFLRYLDIQADTWQTIAVQGIWLVLLLIVLIGLIASTASLFGYRPVQIRATAVFYWTSWLPVIAGSVWALLVFPVSQAVAGQETTWAEALLLPFQAGKLLGICVYVAAIGPLVAARIRLHQAVTQTRYPNA